MQEEIIVHDNSSNKRLDSFIAEKMENLSRTGIQKLVENGKVLVNGKIAKASYKPIKGDKILVMVEEKPQLDLKAQKIPVPIIYEDDDIIVVNKPKGMVVHPANGNPDGTLVNALLGMFEESESDDISNNKENSTENEPNEEEGSNIGKQIKQENKIDEGNYNEKSSYNIKNGTLSNIGGSVRPGIVHRLDKDTSGLLIVAKNDVAHIKMSKEIQDRLVTKKYIALVKGNMPENEATIDLPIARSTKDRKKMAVDEKGKNAVTHFRVLKRYDKYTLLELKIDTGRTHQIRVHLSYIGHPVVGDEVYSNGKNEFGVKGQMLHARFLEFKHPITGKEIKLEAPLPEYFEEVLNKLKDRELISNE